MPYKRNAGKVQTVWGKCWCSQFSSVAQSCLTLCDPMDHSIPGFPVHHQFLELTQAHVHRVGDTIYPSHPLSSPSPAFSLSQHQGLSQGVSSSHQVARGSASVPPMNIRDWFPLRWASWISLQSKGLWRVFSNSTVQMHQFFRAQLSLSPALTSIHDHWKSHSLD